jgi:hypothetical protein
MYKLAALACIGVALLSAQTPSIEGVWKADLGKSKLAGPPPTNYLVLLQRKMAIFNGRTKEEAPQWTEVTGVWGPRGEQRTLLEVFENGKPKMGSYQGIPTRLTGSVEGGKLLVKGEVSGRDSTFSRTYSLAPDGNTLDVMMTAEQDGKPVESHLVLLRQPEAEGDVLRKPEELAGVHYKNVKTETLKALPVSEFINQMRYFAWSLNRNCEFCHVAHKFDADDKREKKTARVMIDMVADIDKNHFEGHPEVRCFTCHESHAHPLSHPQFTDEAAAEKAALEKAAAEARAAAAASQPAPSH